MSNLYQDFMLFIDEPDRNLEDWYLVKLKWMYTGILPILAGIGFAILVELSVADIINSYNRTNEFLFYFRTSYRFFGFFLLG